MVESVAAKWRAPQQLVKGDHQVGDFILHHAAARCDEIAVALQLGDVAQRRVIGAKHLLHRQGLELVVLQIDQVHELLRIIADAFGRVVRLQGGVAERHRARIIVAHPLDGARPQPPHQAGKAVFAADLRRPAVQVAAEGHTGAVRQVVTPELLSLHDLDQDRHALIVILQSLAAAVEQGLGLERAGIGAGDGIR